MDKSLGHEFIVSLNNIRKLAHANHPKIKVHMGEFMMLGAIHGCGKKNNILCGNDGVKVSNLSEIIHSTKPATSKMLKSLEEKEYIERITDTKDRRVVYVRLTQTGKDLFEESIKSLDEYTLRTIQRMGEEDARELIKLMQKFYNAMKEEINESDPQI